MAEDSVVPMSLGGRWREAVHDVAPQLALPAELDPLMSPLAATRQAGLKSDDETRAFANLLGVPFHESLAEQQPSAEFVDRVPIGFAREHLVVGMASRGLLLSVVLGSVESWSQLDVLARHLRRRIEPSFAPREQVKVAINAAYTQQSGQTERVLASFEGNVFEELAQLDAREDLLDTSDRAPVIKLVNTMLFDAVTSLASDVHVQPYEERLVVRMRIDGVLFDMFHVPKRLQEEVLSRIKVLGKMNIAEKRLPQDGRATVEVGDRLIDLRIASMPTSHGERVVIRLLDKSARLYSLGELGLGESNLARFRQLIHREHGMILVTGPTGSGKSTTLYSALREINARELNVVTLEDPIEYQLDGISQTQINVKKGMTFASGLRSILRQDPDVIMLGEIRDQETAVMAIQSALTGHLVFSTLHTNDAASAITRLLDLGIEPYLLASSLVGVLAQRLVRQLCSKCAEPYTPTPEDFRILDLPYTPNATAKRGTGCGACRSTGYRGRFSICELLPINEPIRGQIQSRANASQILATAVQHDMRLMKHDGLEKILMGKTTFEEVAKVTVTVD